MEKKSMIPSTVIVITGALKGDPGSTPDQKTQPELSLENGHIWPQGLNEYP